MKYPLLFLVSFLLSAPGLAAQCQPYEHPSMVWFTSGGAYGEWLTVEIRAPVCRAGSPYAIAYGFGITTLTGPLMLVPPVGVAGSGLIDATGRGVAWVAIPNVPSLRGLPVHFQGGIAGGHRIEIASMLIAGPVGRSFLRTWRDTTLPDFPYPGHARATLAGGQVLITGGKPRGLYLPGPAGYPPIPTMRLYDPVRGTMAQAGNMLRARFGHAIVPLPDGTALIVGGDNPQTAPPVAELYRPGNPTNLGLGTVGYGAVSISKSNGRTGAGSGDTARLRAHRRWRHHQRHALRRRRTHVHHTAEPDSQAQRLGGCGVPRGRAHHGRRR